MQRVVHGDGSVVVKTEVEESRRAGSRTRNPRPSPAAMGTKPIGMSKLFARPRSAEAPAARDWPDVSASPLFLRYASMSSNNGSSFPADNGIVLDFQRVEEFAFR